MKEALRLGGILMLIAAVSGGALFLSNRLTAPRIGGQAEARKRAALKQVLPAATEFTDRTRDSRDLLSRPDFADVREVWEGRAGGKAVGLAVLVAPRGYGGPVVTLVGVEPGGRIAGVQVVSASQETPEVGTKVRDAAFLGQFKGQKAPPLVVVRGQATRPGEVQAVTGATISSRAVVRAVLNAAQLSSSLGRTAARPAVGGGQPATPVARGG